MRKEELERIKYLIGDELNEKVLEAIMRMCQTQIDILPVLKNLPRIVEDNQQN